MRGCVSKERCRDGCMMFVVGWSIFLLVSFFIIYGIPTSPFILKKWFFHLYFLRMLSTFALQSEGEGCRAIMSAARALWTPPPGWCNNFTRLSRVAGACASETSINWSKGYKTHMIGFVGVPSWSQRWRPNSVENGCVVSRSLRSAQHLEHKDGTHQ